MNQVSSDVLDKSKLNFLLTEFDYNTIISDIHKLNKKIFDLNYLIYDIYKLQKKVYDLELNYKKRIYDLETAQKHIFMLLNSKS